MSIVRGEKAYYFNTCFTCGGPVLSIEILFSARTLTNAIVVC